MNGVLDELRARYDESREFSEAEIETWCRATGLSPYDFLNQVAGALAKAFNKNDLGFDVCNGAMVRLCGYALSLPEMPPLFWDVYLAFDGGEVSDDPAVDPVEEYCRPVIAKIVAKLP